MSKIHLLWEGAAYCPFVPGLSIQGLKVWKITDLERRLSQWERLIYWECTAFARKLKESKLARSFKELFLLLLRLMRFSPCQSSSNNFRPVASVNRCLQNETNLVWQQLSERGGGRVESLRGLGDGVKRENESLGYFAVWSSSLMLGKHTIHMHVHACVCTHTHTQSHADMHKLLHVHCGICGMTQSFHKHNFTWQGTD